MTASTIALRPIEKTDVPIVLAMVRELAVHEGEEHYLTITEEAFASAGFGERVRWRGFIAEENCDAIGYVTYTEDFHIWSGNMRIALDDVYVRPDWRGKGAGEQLMRCVFDLAAREGALVSWSVQPENKRAIKFYENLGASVTLAGKCLWRTPD